jgi:hypothetical protein
VIAFWWGVLYGVVIAAPVLHVWHVWVQKHKRPRREPCHCIACKGHASREEHERLGLPDEDGAP